MWVLTTGTGIKHRFVLIMLLLVLELQKRGGSEKKSQSPHTTKPDKVVGRICGRIIVAIGAT